MKGKQVSSGFIRSKYRAFLQLAKKFDKFPLSKLLIYREDSSQEIDNTSWNILSILNDKILSHRSYFLPFSSESISFQEIVKKEFRSRAANESSLILIDVALASFDYFSHIWKTYNKIFQPNRKIQILSQFDPLRDIPIERITNIVPGTILLSNPLAPDNWNKSIILVLSHHSKGSYGVSINHPKEIPLKKSAINLPNSIIDSFGEKLINLGGEIRRLQFIHSGPTLGGRSIPFCKSPTYFSGSVHLASKYIIDHPQDFDNFHFFVGCHFWENSTLQNEVKQGYWIPILSYPDVLLKFCLNQNSKLVQQNKLLGEDLYAYLMSRVDPNFEKFQDLDLSIIQSTREKCELNSYLADRRLRKNSK